MQASHGCKMNERKQTAQAVRKLGLGSGHSSVSLGRCSIADKTKSFFAVI